MNPLKISITLLISVSVPSSGQQIINGSRTLLGNWDASGAATTKPLKAGTAIPAACGLGEMFFKTDATAGANVLLCTGTNTWTPIGLLASVSSVFGRTGAVTAQNGDYNFSQISGQATAGQLPSSVQYFQSGAGAPTGNCTAGQNGYLDTTNLDYWFCDIANGWKKTLSTTNSGAFTLTGQTGTVPATSAAGLATIYLNSSDKTLHSVSDSGTDIQYAGLGEANAWGAFLQDFSASTIKIPIAAGFTTVTNGGLGYDSTANQLHAAVNGVDAIIPTRATVAPASGNCVKWSSNLQLQDSGAVCGGGGGSGTVNAGTAGHFDMRAQFVNASPANRRSVFDRDQYGNWAGGAGYTIRQGFRVGVSAYRGPYLARNYPFYFPGEAKPRDLPGSALGVDVQWGRGPWNVYGEWQRFQMDYRAIPTFKEHTGYAEGRWVLHPRWYIASRVGYLRANAFAGRQNYEFVAGFRPNRHQLTKIGYQIEQCPNVRGTPRRATCHHVSPCFHCAGLTTINGPRTPPKNMKGHIAHLEKYA